MGPQPGLSLYSLLSSDFRKLQDFVFYVRIYPCRWVDVVPKETAAGRTYALEQASRERLGEARGRNYTAPRRLKLDGALLLMGMQDMAQSTT